MNTWFKNLSLTLKVGLVLGLSTVGTLLLAVCALLVFETVTFSKRGELQLDGLSASLGVTLRAPLDFRDAAEATRTLGALESLPDIVEAHVYLENGTPLASYRRNHSENPAPSLRPTGISQEGLDLVLVRPLTRGADTLGTLLLRSDQATERAHFRRSLLLLGALAIFALLAATGLTVVLQRFITAPVLSLAATARRITQNNDFSLRAPPHTSDEIGTLADSFNHMLETLGRNEAALRSSEERYQQVERAVDDGIWDWNILTKMAYLSPRWKAILGYDDAGLPNLESSFFNNIHPDDLPAASAALRSHMELNSRYGVELRIRHKDGGYRWIFTRGVAIRDTAGRPVRMVGAITDITHQKIIAEALRESEAKFATVFRSAPVWIAIRDLHDGKYLDVNEQLLRDTGYSRDDVIGRTASEVGWIAAEDNARWSAAIRTAGSISTIELALRAKDGRSLHCLANGETITFGHRRCLLTVGVEITARKRAEAVLIESEEKFATVFRDAPVWIAISDIADSTILEVNDRALQASGFNREEVISHTATAIGWITADAHASLAHELRTRGRVDDFELMFRTKDRRALCGLVSGGLVVIGGRTCSLTVTVDITARKLAETALVTSERRFASLVNNIEGIVWEADAQNLTFTFVSDFAEILLGYPLSRWFDSNFWTEHVHPEDRDTVIDHFAASTARGEAHDCEYRMIASDGHIVWLHELVTVEATEGKPRVLRGVMFDVTSRKQAELERQKLEAQLRHSQKLEAIGTLAGGIAHDFNNVLSGIYGFTSLARTAAEGNPLVLDYLDEIGQAGRRAAELVKHILAFSRTGEQELGPVHLHHVVVEAIKLLRASIPSTIKFDQHLPADLPPVQGNATQLHQVVMNLGTNAAQAIGDRPGILRILLETCSVDPALAFSLQGISPGHCVRLTISDTGSGMDAATLERAFEPFFTTKAPGQGTGLGLSVVHGIVRSHHGAIRLTSELGRGTTFEIFLPALATTPPPEPADPGATICGHGERILIVDDEQPLVRLGVRTLCKLGYSAEGETQVTAALARLERDPLSFHLVITDQTMPGMTGLEFAAHIHALHPALPVVITSGYSTALTPERLAAAGVREILSKPFTVALLADTVHRNLLTPSLPQNHAAHSTD